MKRCLPICLLLLSFSAHGALTKWVDADGKVHYSDDPPPANVKAEVLVTPRNQASGVPAEKTFAEREVELKKAKKAEEEAARKDAQKQEEILAKRKGCATAKANLTTLENSPRITTRNDKGENILMGDAARRQNIEEARKQISALCN